MKMKAIAVAAACVLPAAITPAAAHPTWDDASGNLVWSGSAEPTSYRLGAGTTYRVPRAGDHALGPRPRRWCGWWMRSQRGGGPELNVAWNWSRWGRPTSPQVGAVVVWRHHVGEIVGQAPNGMWIVRSGNDGGAVRTRARSVAGAVFRI
jgi:hypothetical protein